MRFSLLTLLSSILSLSQGLALEERALYASGGWGLITSDPSDCPSGTQGHSDQDIVTVCCPTNYVSSDISGLSSRICCPPGTSCLPDFQATPSCADSTWVLWNQTLGLPGSFFCCLSGQKGEQTSLTLGCTSGNIDSPSVAAQNVGQPAPAGSAAATITGVPAASSSAGSQTISSTTKSGGLLSSILSVATSHSDAKRIEPRPFNIPLLGVIGWGFTTLAMVGGFALVLGA